MKAMILAAGFGTRLKPLTLARPKALVPVANTPLIDHIIRYLQLNGVSEIVINSHHLSHQLVQYFQVTQYPGLSITVRKEERILGTGGGIRNVRDFWDEDPFIVINGDILTNIDLAPIIRSHQSSGTLATLVLHDYSNFNQVSINNEGYVTGFYSRPFQGGLAFTGIHVMNRRVLDFIPASGFYSIIDAYRKMMASGFKVGAFISNAHYWRDIGTIGSYVAANKEYLKGKKFLISPSAILHPSVRLHNWAIIGHNARLEQGAEVSNSIIWDNCTIKKNTKILRSVMTPQCLVKFC